LNIVKTQQQSTIKQPTVEEAKPQINAFVEDKTFVKQKDEHINLTPVVSQTNGTMIDFTSLTASKNLPSFSQLAANSNNNTQQTPFSFAPATDASNKAPLFNGLGKPFASTPVINTKTQQTNLLFNKQIYYGSQSTFTNDEQSKPVVNLNNENRLPIFGTNNAVPQLFGGSKPAVLFGSQIPKPAGTGEDGDGEDGNANPEEYEPQVDFRPLVVLQEVEVKTGEEDEEVLFKERCKLFRYSSDTKEWKEKGVGEIKILRHKETSAHRVLMRRDQVLKLCANHRILPEIKLELANEKQIRWSTNDYSENEAKHEILLAKFRHEDEAQRFKAEFEKAQTQYSSSTSPSKPHASATVKKSESKPCIGAGSLAELIKTEKGSWSCTQCLVSLYFVF